MTSEGLRDREAVGRLIAMPEHVRPTVKFDPKVANAWKSKAGKTGTFVLFFVLAFGMLFQLPHYVVLDHLLGDFCTFQNQLSCMSSVVVSSDASRFN